MKDAVNKDKTVKKTMELVAAAARQNLGHFVQRKASIEDVKAVLKQFIERDRLMLEIIEQVLAEEPPTGKTQLDVFLERLESIKGKPL